MSYLILVRHPYVNDEGLQCALGDSFGTRAAAEAAVKELERIRAKHIDRITGAGTPLNSYRFEIIRAADSLAEAAFYLDQELDRNLDGDDDAEVDPRGLTAAIERVSAVSR